MSEAKVDSEATSSLISSWTTLLAQNIEQDDYPQLKDLAVSLYEQGQFKRIVNDLGKVNLKAVIIPALFDGYEFRDENHRYLELASHLIFFNKNSAIFFPEDGGRRESAPSFAQLPAVLEHYAAQTERDCFYLLFTRSAQVVYYNKLTKESCVFLCDHNGWGISDYPHDHVFSVLLQRRIAHVDCLVDVPDIDLPPRINPSDDGEINSLIQNGSLFIAFYRAYMQEKVDNNSSMDYFKSRVGYSGHYLKSLGYARPRKLEQFVDYLQERLFPIIDNNIYNDFAEDRTPIMMPVIASSGDISTESGSDIVANNLRVKKVIAHTFYDEEYVEIITRVQLLAFLRKNMEKLTYNDYDQNILSRLDYSYMNQILLQGEIGNLQQLLIWLEYNYSSADDYPLLKQIVTDICTNIKPWANQSTLLGRDQYPSEETYREAIEVEKHLIIENVKKLQPKVGTRPRPEDKDKNTKITVLANLPFELQDDEDVVREICMANHAEIEHASKRLRGNNKFLLGLVAYHYRIERCIGIVTTYVDILKHAEPELIDDVDFLVAVTKIIKYLPMNVVSRSICDNRRAMLRILDNTDNSFVGVTFAESSKRLRNCPWFVLSAIRQTVINNGYSSLMKYAGEKLQKDPNFVMQVLKVSGSELRALGEEFTADSKYVTPAVMHSGKVALRAASKELQEDKFLRFAAVAYPTDSQAVLIGLFTTIFTTAHLKLNSGYSFWFAALVGITSAIAVGRSYYSLNTSKHNEFLARNYQQDDAARRRNAEPEDRNKYENQPRRAADGITPKPIKRNKNDLVRPERHISPSSFGNSVFHANDENKKVKIAIEWKGKLSSQTREYTTLKVMHNSQCIASFRLDNKKLGADNKLLLGISDPILTKDSDIKGIEIHLVYLKCSSKHTVYLRDSYGNFNYSPQYIGDGKYVFTPNCPVSRDSEQTRKLVIENLSNGTRVTLKADFEPISQDVAEEERLMMNYS